MKRAAQSDENRSFGLVMAGGVGALALIRYFWAGTMSEWMIGAALAFLTAALIVPAWLGPARAGWMKLAAVLGYINSRILLTLVFAVVMIPMALLLRLLGKQPIRREAEAGTASYWHQRDPAEFAAARLERQF
jgi:hypothetical protein